jgi:hypothetical protein
MILRICKVRNASGSATSASQTLAQYASQVRIEIRYCASLDLNKAYTEIPSCGFDFIAKNSVGSIVRIEQYGDPHGGRDNLFQ